VPCPPALPLPLPKIACGPNFCLAVTGGCLWSWGSGDGFVLGHGDARKRETPTPVEYLKGSVVLQVR
ncbi:unnamed protein product, partial [Choristocarpus tenellus]